MATAGVIVDRLALIGVGLIGGSLARSLKQTGGVGEVIGAARTAATLQKALDLSIIDRAEASIEAAVRDAQLVVVATPMQAMPTVLASIEGSMDSGAIVTDVGSVKNYVVEAARIHLNKGLSRFVPGHPIAGKEHAGVEASRADLFEDKSVILTPGSYTDVEAVGTVTAMWQRTGADVQTMNAVEHDRLLAATSHLPHIVAYALVDLLARHRESGRLFELAAGGFYDFTRIASSDPVMWRDICLTNRDEILGTLKGYRANIDDILRAIEDGDEQFLFDCFERAKQSRDSGLVQKDQNKDQNKTRT